MRIQDEIALINVKINGLGTVTKMLLERVEKLEDNNSDQEKEDNDLV